MIRENQPTQFRANQIRHIVKIIRSDLNGILKQMFRNVSSSESDSQEDVILV